MQFFDILFTVWLIASLCLFVRLKVFRPEPLRTAPTRVGLMSLPVAGLVLLLYLTLQVAVVVAVFGGSPPSTPGSPASQPATASQSAPSTITADSQPVSTTSATRPGLPPSTTAPEPPATAPAGLPPTLIFQGLNDVIQLSIAGIFLLAVPRLFIEGYRGLGLHPGQAPLGILLGVCAFIAVFPAILLADNVTVLIGIFFHHDIVTHPTILELQRDPPALHKLILRLTACTVAPIAEEIFFRGILQTSLIQQGWGLILRPLSDINLHRRPSAAQRWIAIAVASTAFASAHSFDHRLVLFIFALALGYLYERTGNLWAPISLHATFNIVALWQST